MPIDLGLSRISRLLAHLGNPQLAYNSIHVAGTNGKGSTVAYLSSVFTAAKIRNGRFTSPHMVHYNDCIVIDGEIYPIAKFNAVSKLVKSQDADLQLGCTEFELLTATAFKIFQEEQISMAVIEVGLGGRLDATNVLQPPSLLATAITKIGLDHEKLLGGSLASIAREKAGIIKQGVPIAVDATNDEKDVLQVIRAISGEKTAPLVEIDSNIDPPIYQSPLHGAYQKQNLALALEVLRVVLDTYPISQEVIASGIKNTKWPGRLETVLVNGHKVLLDGAHNESAAIELGKYLDSICDKTDENGRVFIIAMTEGKAVDLLLKYILKANDTVVATNFSQPENMPWIKSMKSQEILEAASKYTSNVKAMTDQSIELVIGTVALEAGTKQIIVCGSLYLCADVLRLT